MLDYAGMRASILASFGEPVIVTRGAVSTTITAAYMAPYTSGVDLGGVPINRPDPQFIAATDAWNATNAGNNDTITRAGVVFTIYDVQSSDDGMSTISARNY